MEHDANGPEATGEKVRVITILKIIFSDGALQRFGRKKLYITERSAYFG
jgi:hypothetical protein